MERELPENTSQEEIEITMQNDMFMFVPEETGTTAVQEFEASENLEMIHEFLYDRQFADEAGNIYPILEDEG